MRLLAIVLTLLLASCGGGGSSPAPKPCAKPAPHLSAVPVLIAYGDSTMYGSKAMLRDALEDKGYTVEFDNRGIGGTMLYQLNKGSCEYPVVLDKDLADEPAGEVVIENFGINEAANLINPVSFDYHVRRFVTSVRNAGMVPVLVTPVKTMNAAKVSPSHLATLAQIKRDVAAELGVRLVDVYALPVTTADFLPDLIHPTDAFYAEIAEFTAEEIKDLL